nr:unnamed protein product [Callosobruchus analis]
MVCCAVAGCRNNNSKKSKHYSSNCRYFGFPTANKEICKLWVQRCCQKYVFNTKNARICSDHFSDEAYCRKEKLLQLPRNKWKLKEDAVPSLKLLKPSEVETADQKNRKKRAQKRNLIKNIQEL